MTAEPTPIPTRLTILRQRLADGDTRLTWHDLYDIARGLEGLLAEEAAAVEVAPDQLVDHVEAVLFAEHHANLCNCKLWPGGCVNGLVPAFTLSVEDVLRVAAPLVAARAAADTAERIARATLARHRNKVRNLRRYLIQPGTPMAGMAIDRIRRTANRIARHDRRYSREIHDLHAAYGRKHGRA